MEVWSQFLGQEPGSDVEVLIMRLCQMFAPCARRIQRGSNCRNSVAIRQSSPASLSKQFRLGCWIGKSAHNTYGNASTSSWLAAMAGPGRIAVLTL